MGDSKSSYTTPDPEWVHFTAAFPVPALVGTAAELRAMAQGMSVSPSPDSPGCSIRDEEIPGSGGASNKVRIYVPDKQSPQKTTIAYVHGGGWTIGSLDSEDAVCRSLCTETGSVVVSIDYRKSPEHPFPIPLEDVWAGVLWVLKNIQSLSGSDQNILIGGNSAGANMSAVLAQRAKTTGTINFKGQILRNPMVCHFKALPEGYNFTSYQENANAALLPAESVYSFVEFYNPPPTDIRFSPLLAKDFQGLPPAYIQVSGSDPLRDDGLAYAEKLKNAGVPVRTDIYPGLPHNFFLFAHLESAKKCARDLVDGVNALAA